MDSNSVTEYLEEKKKIIDSKIKEYLPPKITKEYLESIGLTPRYEHDYNALTKATSEPIWDFLFRGGKRWRPALFLLITEALGGNPEKLSDFAIIPELAHNGSIIIDDIEDMGEIRRGKPCIHKIYGIDIAINAGNLLYFIPLLVFRKHSDYLKPETLKRAYEVYSQEMINIHFGQATDIYWHKGSSNNITEKQYLQMCSYKTGCLSRMAARLAAVLCECGREEEEKLGKIGEAVGIAFQIRDDVLSIIGEEFSKKKGFGDDITEGKRSLPVIYTLQKAEKEDKERLITILNMHTRDKEKINEAINIIKKYGSVEEAMKTSRKIITEAWGSAEPLLKDSDAKKMLKMFLDFLVERKI